MTAPLRGRFSRVSATPRTRPGGSIRAMLTSREARFLVVGGLNTLIGLAIFATLHLLLGDRVDYLVTLVLTYAVGTVIAFALQRRLVFGAGAAPLTDLARFTLVQVGALALNAVLLHLLVEVAGIWVIAAQVVALGIVVVTSYFSHLLFSFRRSDPPS